MGVVCPTYLMLRTLLTFQVLPLHDGLLLSQPYTIYMEMEPRPARPSVFLLISP